jgi:hypothetical protein
MKNVYECFVLQLQKVVTLAHYRDGGKTFER